MPTSPVVDARTSPRETRLVWLLCAAMAVAAAASVLVATSRWGAVVSWDSLAYLGFATDSQADERTIVQFCPLFPLALKAFAPLQISSEQAARYLNSALLGATVVLAAVALRRQTRWVWAPVLGAALVLSSRVLLEQYVRVMSDPLGLFLGFFGLVALARYLETPRFGWLVLASAGVGLGLATRYGCLPFVVAGAIALVARPGVRLPRRLLDAAAFCGLTIVPLALWLTHNVLWTGHALDRRFALHPPRPEMAGQAIDALSTWLLPPRVPAIARYGFLVLFAAAIVWLVGFAHSRGAGPWRAPLARLLRTFLVCYAIFILLVTTVLDATVNVGTRHWLPVYFACLLLAVILVDGPLGERLFRGRRFVAVGVAGFLVLSAIFMAAKTYLLARDGAEYTRRAMQKSVLQVLREPTLRSRPIYSNDPEAVSYIAGATARRFPTKFEPQSRQSGPTFSVDMKRMDRDLRERAGLTVRFAGLPESRYPSVEELEVARSMRIVAHDDTATIYGPGP